MTKILEAIKEFWKRHICDEFPSHYDPQCFDCNKSTCHNCPSKFNL